ncbi:unnamed protein product [Rotaria sp. Silwood2]|nr:unnamed protein product [Rotaria sp. Silwood2]CAF2915657.1 unnamed protein product [Rotaria sp. Silwood2]CAF3312729.1 unnamed protein product [Rotaria sp. Silwood2]CAF3358997.1 unnamed protein product [Rotaria sp. Silwood2]CAF4205198.1 unnamed protein product [Rotaria sp. Silwood2]
MFLNTDLHRRHLSDNFDERIQQCHQSFVVTIDNHFIISTDYWDKNFCVKNTDMARTTQVLYGHFDIVTCAYRSDITIAGTIVDKQYPNQEINPLPAAILIAHDTEIRCLWISAELAIVLTGSEHCLILQHTLQGDI